MSSLAVTRSLVTLTNPTEAQFDTMRTDLLNYFNAASLNEDNVATGGMLFTSLTTALDNVAMKWTASDALIKFISATPTFHLENALGAIVFYNKPSTTAAECFRLATTGKTTVGSGGLLKHNQSVGSQAVDTQWLLSRYRKPLLEYTSDDIVTSENNSPNASETLLMIRDRLCVMVDRTMSLAATANGYGAAHTGAAVSGIRSGLARASNTWYYIYGVLVSYGSDNGGTKAIMVADTTSPVQANCAALDTQFVAGKWVYLGVIRNGYNDGTTDAVIVPFSYDGYGNLRFTTTTETGQGHGIRFASAAASTDLTYTLTFGTGATDLPVVATRGVFSCFRSADGFVVDYIRTSTGEIQAQASSCVDTDTLASSIAAVQLDVPFIDGFKVVINVGAASTTNKIRLASLVDHYV